MKDEIYYIGNKTLKLTDDLDTGRTAVFFNNDYFFKDIPTKEKAKFLEIFRKLMNI